MSILECTYPALESVYGELCPMSAMGHKQPLSIHLGQWLLSATKSGHSDSFGFAWGSDAIFVTPRIILLWLKGRIRY